MNGTFLQLAYPWFFKKAKFLRISTSIALDRGIELPETPYFSILVFRQNLPFVCIVYERNTLSFVKRER